MAGFKRLAMAAVHASLAAVHASNRSLKVPAYGASSDMTKKDLVALAETLRAHNRTADGRTEFTPDHLLVLAEFCASRYPNFNRRRWIDYITGEGEELIFVDPDSPLNPAATLEDNTRPTLNGDKGAHV
jgi:hypothetical protein